MQVREMKNRRRLFAVLLIATLALPAMSVAQPAAMNDHDLSAAALAAMSRAFRQAAARVQPAVVSVHTAGLLVSADDMDSGQGRRMKEMLRNLGIEPDENQQYHLSTTGIGSGMVVDADRGLILTNYHVVESVERIYVTLFDGREFDAKVINTDPASDMAILQIENADELTAVDFADSRDVRVGDFVLAFGAPLGYEQTMTHGVVSAMARSATSALPVTYQNFIQTDASINQGNSGGPLTNLHGDVVGMNTAIATDTGYDAGIGFAIPSSRIIALLPRLKNGEAIVRGYLGVRMSDVRVWRNRAIGFGWHERYGVIVEAVMSGTPADAAGLQKDDIVHEINGETIQTGGDLQDAIALTPPGSHIRLGIFRDGERKELDVTIGEQPEDFIELANGRRGEREDVEDADRGANDDANDVEAESSNAARLGVAILPLNDRLREAYGWGTDEHGFVIVEVERGSLAARRGLSKGDLITELDGKPLVRGHDLTERVRGHLRSIGIRLTVKSHHFGEREMIFRENG